VILCNCDDPYESNFFRYFALNFNALGLKKLIATSYAKSSIVGGYLPLVDMAGLKPEGKEPYAIEISEVPDANGDGAIDLADVEYLLRHDANTCCPLKGDSEFGAGDFRSAECVEYLKQADVVVTNPPFSLFREYVAQLVGYQKSFVIVGSKNSVTTKEIFALIKSGNLWLGNGFAAGNAYFKIPKHNARDFAAGVYDDATGLVKFRNVGWFTNLDFKERHEQVPLYKSYSPDRYPEYDNYNAIEISKTSDIPRDYNGIMGVPVTFLDMFKPEQFEIIGITKTWFGLASKKYPSQQQFSTNGDVSEVSKLNDGAVIKLDRPPLGKTYYKVGEDVFIQTYPRILIRRK
jgi:Adenine-specific methyltransferase EcoRI